MCIYYLCVYVYLYICMWGCICVCIRDVRGSIFFDPAQPNPPTNWPNPTQPIANVKLGPTTQPNPRPNPTARNRTLDTMKTSYGTIMYTQIPQLIAHEQQLAHNSNPMPHSWTKLSFRSHTSINQICNAVNVNSGTSQSQQASTQPPAN